MSNSSYRISFALASRAELGGVINRTVLPLVHQAVRAVAKHTASSWQEAVLRQSGIWSSEKDAYASSIGWQMTGDFSAVVETDYKLAQEIETGRPARDMKRMLNTSDKVRRTKDGRRFLVIPMRQNTPGQGGHAGAMPSGVYDLAKDMDPSSVVGQGQRPSGQVTHLVPGRGMIASTRRRDVKSPFLSSTSTKQAAQVAARSYAWGGRLTGAAMRDAGIGAADRKRYSGMVRMEATTPGGVRSSSYLTFRIMMEGSSGWVVAAQPGRFIARDVAADMQPKAEAAFGEAMRRSLKV